MTETLHNRPELPYSPTMDRSLDPGRSTPTEQALIDRLKIDYAQPHRHHHTLEPSVTQIMACLA